jgi:CO/xanthine dehydrogenase Mo-binding subunit
MTRERDELAPAAGPGLKRRSLLRVMALAGGGFALGVHWVPAAQAAARGDRADAHPEDGGLEPNAWLCITADDRIRFQLDKAEMGQGVITALPMLLAEELEVDPGRIGIEIAPVDPLFQDPMQITGGSTSVTTRWLPLRRTGAAAREMLCRAAARAWSVPVESLAAEAGRIVHGASGRSAPFGDFATAAARERVPRNPSLKAPTAFRVIGRSVPRSDRVSKATGRATFGIDVAVAPQGSRLPGLATAVLARAPRFGSRLQSWDGTGALAAVGVLDVVEVETGVAVVAAGYWAARQGLARLEATWTPGPDPELDSAAVLAGQRAALAGGGGRRVRDDGDVHEGLRAGARVLEAEYRVPFLAHATMEPMNCTAWYRDGVCDVWAPSQAPDVAQALVADAVGLARSKVRVHGTLMGGGFGRRGIPDFAAEAAAVSKACGRPVKVIWSREDDLRHDYYRPSTCNLLRGALDGAGRITAWEHRMAAPSMLVGLLPTFAEAVLPQWVPDAAIAGATRVATPLLRTRDGTSHEGAVEMPYSAAHVRVEHVHHDVGVPLGFWRSVGHSQNAFVVEGFIDELAHAAAIDPLAFRLQLLDRHPRHRAVLERVRDAAPWGLTAPGRHQGVAVHECFGTLVAQIAEVSVTAGRVKVHRVTCAVDCGLVVNPEIVRAQMASGILFGLTAALTGEITLAQGAVVQSNFHDYGLLRMDEAPEIEVHLLSSAADPAGVGEPGTPPIAPAVANAIFAATGQRLRSLPLRLA